MSDEKYHINPETGRPGICRAVQRCKYGEAVRHYGSKEEARAGYEKLMKHLETPEPVRRELTAGEHLMSPVMIYFRERRAKAKTPGERAQWDADYSRLVSFAQRTSSEEIAGKPYGAYRDYLRSRWEREKDWKKKESLHRELQRMNALVTKLED